MITKIEQLPFVKKIQQMIFFAGSISRLSLKTFYGCISRPFYFHRMTEQILALGFGSLSLAIVIGLVMGSVMTLQFGYGLQKFGGTLYVPAIVSLSLLREMAPIFISLLVAGRVGSGIAAEIGSMNVTQQVDALRALGTDPIRVLVVPRLMALLISLPLLCTVTDIFGLIGGLFVATSEFEMTANFYFVKIISTIKMRDFWSGLIKTLFFATIIVMVACYRGLNTVDGTRGVGKSTTWVVVTSSIWILITNFIISKFLLTFWTL
jgi:phospholipid/cholesterol/gamma-HCH transport system permease protein